MSDKKILIINPQQFGLNTDYVMYARYLGRHFKSVSYLTVDQGFPRRDEPGVRYHYVPRCRVKQLSYALFLIRAIAMAMTFRGTIMTSNFTGCRILKRLLPWRRMAVNIRTVSVDPDEGRAAARNRRILADVQPFDRIIMISDGGAQQLGLPEAKTNIVSLGADELSTAVKNYDYARCLYIGTLTGRNILQTVQGFHAYISAPGSDSRATYDIVGDGEEMASIRAYVEAHSLAERVRLHGFVAYDKLKPFLDRCNVGVSYVPVTRGFMYQPPTKTFEYINSGLWCIATATAANEAVVTAENGIIIADTPEAFREALLRFDAVRGSLSDSAIRSSGRPYLWPSIIDSQLIPALNSF